MEYLLRWRTVFGIILDESKSINEPDKPAIGMLNSGGLWCFGRKEKIQATQISMALVILVAFCLESKEIQDSQSAAGGKWRLYPENAIWNAQEQEDQNWKSQFSAAPVKFFVLEIVVKCLSF